MEMKNQALIVNRLSQTKTTNRVKFSDLIIYLHVKSPFCIYNLYSIDILHVGSVVEFAIIVMGSVYVMCLIMHICLALL